MRSRIEPRVTDGREELERVEVHRERREALHTLRGLAVGRALKPGVGNLSTALAEHLAISRRRQHDGRSACALGRRTGERPDPPNRSSGQLDEPLLDIE